MLVKSLLKPVTETFLQQAIHEELYASNLYKHIANTCQRLGYFGAAKYFKSESNHEQGHYQKIADYLNDRGGIAEIPAIEAIECEITNLKDALAEAYTAELELGKLYDRLFTDAMKQDPATAVFLLDFIGTQSKSIGEYGDMLTRIAIADDNNAAILMIDNELGAK